MLILGLALMVVSLVAGSYGQRYVLGGFNNLAALGRQYYSSFSVPA